MKRLVLCSPRLLNLVALLGVLLISTQATVFSQGKPSGPVKVKTLPANYLPQYQDAVVILSGNTVITPAKAISSARMTVITSSSFKGGFVADPASGIVRVTNANPAGTYEVNVYGFDSTGAMSSQQSFMMTVATPPSLCNNTFAPGVNYPVGQGPYGLSVGDFNRDGKQDLAVTNRDSSNTSILIGTGAGTFMSQMTYPNGGYMFPITVADLNGDGYQDLAGANLTLPPRATVLFGTGTGAFNAPIHFADVNNNPIFFASGDFNGDGKHDFVTSHGAQYMSILLGMGNGNFGTAASIFGGTGVGPGGFVVGDFNGDNKLDLATTAHFPERVAVYIGTGSGTFGPVSVNTVGPTSPFFLTLGDFNNDGKQDLVTVGQNGGDVTILLGTGTGVFPTHTNFPAGGGSMWVAVGDFNNDGKQDLVNINSGATNVSILFGTGTGSFGAPISFPVANLPTSVAVGDFNGDGRQDLAVTNFWTNNVTVLMSQCPASPVITVTPSTLAFGETTVGTNSLQQNYVVSGSNLSSAIVVTPPTGFQISLTSGTGFSTGSISLPQVSGTVNATTVYVRHSPIALGPNLSNFITHTSMGAAQKNLGVSGYGR